MRTLVALLLFALPAIPAHSQDRSAAAPSAAGCGPDKVKFDVKTDKHQHVESQPEPGKALVYVFEQVKLDSDELPVNLATIRLGLDGQWVGANHGRSYFSFAVDPGDHSICASWQTTWVKVARLAPASSLASAASLTAEAGKVYYFEANVDERNHDRRQPGVKLEAVDPAEAKLLIADSSLSTSHPKK
jgi:hypothetical protein